MAGLFGNAEQINCTDTSSQKRLVSISPSCVHKKTTLVLADGLGEGLGSLLKNDVSPSLGARLGSINLLSGRVDKLRDLNLSLELWLSNLSLDAATIDGNITEVGKKLLGTVLTANEIEQLRGIVDESSPASSINKGRVGKKRSQEGDVGSDTSNTELDQRSENLSTSNLVSRTMASTLGKHGIVVGSDDSTSETVTSIQTDTITTGRSVDLDLTSIGLEALGRVLSCDTALDGKATSGDAVLRKTKLVQSGTSSDLDLSSNDVDSGDLLSDSVLDLDTRVDLDKVVTVLLVDQELRSACIAVAGCLGQSNSVGENVVTDLSGEIFGRGNLDNLLVSSLDGAVTLVQVNDVTMVVTEELDLNVLGLVKEALNKDSTVTKGSLGLGSSTLKGLLEALLVTDYSHTTTTTTESGLDDNGESILVSEILDLFVSLNGTLSTRNDRDVGSVGELSGRDLVTERVNDIGGGADEDEASLLDLTGKLGVLGKKTVTWKLSQRCECRMPKLR
jgi:hypothetical protein